MRSSLGRQGCVSYECVWIMRRQSQYEELNTGVTWQELKIKRKEEFQSWRRNPPWENSQTEQAAFVGTEQNWGFLCGKFKMLNSKREIPCREGSASVSWGGLRDVTLFLSLTDDNQTLLGYLSPCCERNCFHLNTHRYFDKPSSRFDFQARKKTRLWKPGDKNTTRKSMPQSSS